MGILGLFTGHSTLLVGVEDDPEGGIRCYLGHRASGRYCVVEDPKEIAEIRAAWAGSRHVVVPTPPAEFIYCDDQPERDPEAEHARDHHPDTYRGPDDVLGNDLQRPGRGGVVAVPSKLYNTPQAGLNAYQLMEELSELYAPGGWVEVRKTMNSGGAISGHREYPPVYEVTFRPNHWPEISRELTDKLHDLADRWEATMTIVIVRNDLGHGQAVFRFKAA